MNSTGMNTATSDSVIERMVKPISREPSSAACSGGFPFSMWRYDVLEHDDGVVHDEADRERERHQREVVEAVAEAVHHREGADHRHRQRQARDDRGGQVAQEEEDDQHDQHQRQQQRELHVLDRVADGLRAVVEDVRVRPRPGSCGRSRSSMRAHVLRRPAPCSCRAGAGSASMMARCALEPARRPGCSARRPRPRRGRAARTGAAVAPGHDQRAEVVRVLQLAVGLHGRRAVRAPQDAGGQVHVAAPMAPATSSMPMPQRGQRVRVELDAHRVLLRAEDRTPGPRPAPSRAAAPGSSRAYSFRLGSGMSVEVSAMNRMGESAGFTFW